MDAQIWLTIAVLGTVSGNEPETETPATQEESAEVVDTVVVIGSGAGSVQRESLAGAYDIVSRSELELEHPDDTYELFNKIPGVVIARYNQGIINTDVAIRGFAGDGTTPHAKLLIDGVPFNLHNGYGELDQLFPLGIETINVFKGTSDVRYGLYNIAGNYNVQTRSDEAIELLVDADTFESFELQGYLGHSFGKLSQSISAGYRQSAGYRAHSDIKKYAVSGRWFYDLNADTSVGFITRLATYDADSPGYLDRETARADPRSSADYANQDGGDKSTQHYSLHFRKDLLDDTLHLQARAYVQSIERERWVRFSEGGSLQDRFDDQEQVGAIFTVDFNPAENWLLSAGVDIEDQDNLEQRFGTRGQARIRDTSNVIRSHEYELQVVGGFFQVQHTLFDRIRWNIGLRVDHLDGDFVATNAEGEQTPGQIYDFGLILQPKANVLINVIDGLTIFGNVGRSFQHPFGSALYTDGDRSDREVSINDGWEAGLKWAMISGLVTRISYWQQYAYNEFVSVDGIAQNVGETQRSGIELSGSWYIIPQLSIWGNIGWNFTEIVDAGNEESALATVGNKLRSIPEFTASLGARYDITDSLYARLHVDAQGSYYVNELNAGGKYGEYIIAHADIGYQTDTDRISLRVNNLFDQYFEYVFDFSTDGTSTIHSPGNGLQAGISYARTF